MVHEGNRERSLQMQDDTPSALILDNDICASSRLRRLLEELGFAVRETDETAVALELLAHEEAHTYVTFFAVELPRNRMSGDDHTELIGALLRDLSLAERHAFIAVTESPETVEMTLGGLLARLSVPIITEPFGLETLREVIAVVTEHRDHEAIGIH
jgi:CheY-like chemotaxis protein